MRVEKSDVAWNYGATIMRMASAVIILPLMLHLLSGEEVGLWMVMIELFTMINLLDFGFNPTFTRTITYVFSGAKELKKTGFIPLEGENNSISYPLLNGVISAMKHYYSYTALFLLILLSTAGVWYIDLLLADYTGDIRIAKIAWFSYGALICFQFFTFYYDALLVGRGMIRKSRQIIVTSQSLHIVIASILLLLGYGIMSLVIGQFCATIINRFLSRRAFYDKEIKANLSEAKRNRGWKEILKTLFNTAYKSGISAVSVEFTKGLIPLIGALYIPLAAMASYGITKRIISLTAALATAWFIAYYPKLTNRQIRSVSRDVKHIYLKAGIIAVLIFVITAVIVIPSGNTLLRLIGSEAHLLPVYITILFFASSLFEVTTYFSTSVLLSRNEVPHYRAHAITALFTILLLFAGLKYGNQGVGYLVLLPFITQLAYQYWQWTYKVWRELKITGKDLLNEIIYFDISGKNKKVKKRD